MLKNLKVSKETREPKLLGLSRGLFPLAKHIVVNPSFRILLDSIGHKQLILAVTQMTAGKVQHIPSYLRELGESEAEEL